MLAREAMFYRPLADGAVECLLCPHRCHIAPGRRGVCGVRLNEGGTLRTLVYDRLVAAHLDPVEKKPLFHVLPGSMCYSVATVGCNLHCRFCQNWEISQWRSAREPPGLSVTPGQVVDAAVGSGAASIAYTYTEPTVFYEFVLETARLARAAGLKNVLVTSGYIAEEPLRQLAPWIDAANVDLKFFRDATYRRLSGVRLAPILEAIRLYRQLGVWLELTTLVIPGVNDADAELSQIAAFVRSLGSEVPWHVSGFMPAYRMLDTPPTPPETLHRACRIGRDAGLWHVYEGNLPGGGGEDTHCARCGTLLIARRGYDILRNVLHDGRCPECHSVLDGIFSCREARHAR